MKNDKNTNRPEPIFSRLGLPEQPVFLAPLAGVSDHPFRRVCQKLGADLTFVEMLSAVAILQRSRRTLEMLQRHPDEPILGVQLTGRNADEVARAVDWLNRYPFEVVDINMGCPVRKVVSGGSGSAILKDPERVYQTVLKATQSTDRPVTAKIRLGWDHKSINAVEVGLAAQEGGAAWLTVHGRTRADDYSVPVNLEKIAEVKAQLHIPVIGNGNIFSRQDMEYMTDKTGVDGVMVSRGALGNPWIFREIKGDSRPVTLQEWLQVVTDHLRWQQEAYGNRGIGAICMRKHLLWYTKGWPGSKHLREKINVADDLQEAIRLIENFATELEKRGVQQRLPVHDSGFHTRFVWDPKYDMDRQLDRGVGDDGLAEVACSA
ncbi:MAG: tRNA dihydrouridine synthase DusB [candidate division KSB1 bacterium]|nr:tRNA dihydrouridine synthase DusB [candidate division KSB1 bacterium]MDQ7063330.1 tRNA dihydrouridine synthase DusB [candidate division KSB1 bacterium]